MDAATETKTKKLTFADIMEMRRQSRETGADLLRAEAQHAMAMDIAHRAAVNAAQAR